MPLNRLKLLINCYVDGNSTHPQMRRHTDPVMALHGLARTEKHLMAAKKYGGKLPPAWIGFIIQWTLWPVLSLYYSIKEFRATGKKFGRNWVHVIPDISGMWWQAMRYNLSPFHYYIYDMHDSSWARGKENQLYAAWEFNCLSRRMSRLRGHTVGMLDNKDRFHQFCSEHSLPTTVHIDLEDGGVVEQLGERDLFVKMVFGHSGHGCRLLEYDSSLESWRFDGSHYKAAELKPVLDSHYGKDPYMVSYRYKNRDDLKWISERVLTTLRIMTAWNAEGGVDLLRVTLRVPGTADAIIDNSSQGGLNVPVDPKTGQLTGPGYSWRRNHKTEVIPANGRKLEGYRLPDWNELIELLTRAHSAAGNYNFLGWDVAFAEEGILLTECNVWSAIELMQIPQQQPFLNDDVLPYFLLEECLWKEGNS